jgi:uncharacterized protein YkwD
MGDERSPRNVGMADMRRGLGRIAVVCTLIASIGAGTLTGATASGATLRRQKMLAWVNDARAKHNVRPLKMDTYVVGLAHDHNVEMARKHKLFHTKHLGSKLRSVNWHSWGENIGAGVTPWGLFRAYMASPEHRANILDKNFDHVGINFVVRHGIMWSTMDFYG